MSVRHPRQRSDVKVLSEMLRECERTLELQLDAMMRLDEKGRHFLTLGVAALAGGATLGLLAVQGNLPFVGAPIFLVLTMAGASNLTSLIFFATAYMGFRPGKEAHLGPDLRWIRAKSNLTTWALVDHYLSLIDDYPSYYAWNEERIVQAGRFRRWGLVFLLGSVLFYAATLIYIGGRSIVG